MTWEGITAKNERECHVVIDIAKEIFAKGGKADLQVREHEENRKRSQNNLQFHWFKEMEQQGDKSAKEYRAQCKLEIGVPIARGVNAMKIISKKIRQSAKGENCSLRASPQCDHDQTVVLCHINSRFKGVGIKSPDIFSCYACAYCHAELDSSNVSAEDVIRAWQETLMKLCEKGLVTVAA